VRRATTDDVDAITRLYLELKRHHRPLALNNPRYDVAGDAWRARAARRVVDPKVFVYVVERDARVIGFIEFGFEEKPWGISCEVETLVVEAEHRNQRWGEALMEEAEKRARYEGARGMRVDVLAVNADARRFYERLGYDLFAVRYGKPLDVRN